MGENNDSIFDKILLKNIDEEIPIGVASLIDRSAKNPPSATKTNSFSTQTKKSKFLQSLKKIKFHFLKAK